jgi:hypothetical protein
VQSTGRTALQPFVPIARTYRRPPLGSYQKTPIGRHYNLPIRTPWRPASLHASSFAGTATIVRNGCRIFDQLHGNPCSLQRGNRRFPTRTRSLDPNLNLLHTELGSLFSSLLCRHLPSERRTLPRSLEIASSRTGPTQRIATHVRDRNLRVVEGRLDEGDGGGHIATHLASLVRCVLFVLLFGHDSILLRSILRCSKRLGRVALALNASA